MPDGVHLIPKSFSHSPSVEVLRETGKHLYVVKSVSHCSLRLLVVVVRLLGAQWSRDAWGWLRGLRLRLVGALVLEAVDALALFFEQGEKRLGVLARSLDQEAHSLVSGLQLGDFRLRSAEMLVKVAQSVVH